MNNIRRKTHIMGWASWNRFTADISEDGSSPTNGQTELQIPEEAGRREAFLPIPDTKMYIFLRMQMKF